MHVGRPPCSSRQRAAVRAPARYGREAQPGGEQFDQDRDWQLEGVVEVPHPQAMARQQTARLPGAGRSVGPSVIGIAY
jgi:hypothetical protein